MKARATTPKEKEKIRIVPFTNPSGAAVYRVTGFDRNGKRVRVNFPTRGEAAAAKQRLDAERENLPVVPMLRSSLTDAQAREAERAFDMMGGKSLMVAVEFYQKNYQESDKPATLQDAFARFMAAQTSEFNNRPATIQNLKNRVGRFVAGSPGKLVSEVLKDAIKDAIFRPGRSRRTQINDRAALSAFFSWCVKNQHCRTNPVESIEAPKTDEGSPVILPLAECRKLVNAASTFKEGKLEPYVSLALFCAIRPAELARLNWGAIDLKKNIVRIGGKMGKKRKKRNVEISENCAAILRRHAVKHTPIIGPNWRKDFDAVKLIVGFGTPDDSDPERKHLKEWVPDILRHTGISHHLQKHAHEGLTARWAGNSPDVIQESYKDLVEDEDTEEFWTLQPTEGANIIGFKVAA